MKASKMASVLHELQTAYDVLYRKYLELYEQRQVQALKAKRKTAAKKAA